MTPHLDCSRGRIHDFFGEERVAHDFLSTEKGIGYLSSGKKRTIYDLLLGRQEVS